MTIFLVKSSIIGPNFFLHQFKIKIILNFVIFVVTIRGRTTIFFLSSLLLLFLDPGSGIDKNQDPGSATLFLEDNADLDGRQEGATGDGHCPGSNPRLSLVRLSSQPRLLRFMPAKSSNGLADGRANPLRGLLNHLSNNIYNLYIFICRKSIIRELLSSVGDPEPDPDLGLWIQIH
jgi:hypothetical protein